MKTISIAYGAAIIAAALATPAMSITVPSGTYSGTSADGNPVSFVVGTDSNTGEQAVTAVNIFFTAPCKNNGYVLSTGWGLGVLDDIHSNGRVLITANDYYFRFVITLAFVNDDGTYKASGTVLSTSTTLFPVGAQPTYALICTAPTQALDVMLNPDAPKELAIPANAQINLHSPRANDDAAVEASH